VFNFFIFLIMHSYLVEPGLGLPLPPVYAIR
jgi:hypothetical protein